MNRRAFLHIGLLTTGGPVLSQAARTPQKPSRVPDHVKQLIVGIADSWNASRGRLQLFQRNDAASPWVPALPQPVAVLYGRNGLAWGNGVIPVPHGRGSVLSKREKDRRAPAGLFKIGMLYGYAPTAPQGCAYSWYQVTARDCWIDDVTHPAYNKHVTVNPSAPPAWYHKQRMRLGDFAYEWLVEIRHNADPPLPGHGSAIFFHIRRGPDKPSSGCTTMARPDLLKLVRWLRTGAHPHYVLLPRTEYAALTAAWGLPALP